MALHTKHERARLVRTMEQLLKSWEKLDPESAAKYRAAEAALKVLVAPGDGRYRQFRGTADAVRACLEFEKKWLPRQVIADKLFDGGFVMDPEFGRRLVVKSITTSIGRGIFVEDAEKLVGLPEWEHKDR